MSRPGYVYLLRIPETGVYKIGVSIDVEKRIKQLQTGNTEEITLVNKFYSNYPYKIESNLHRRYGVQAIKGEWFYLEQKDVDTFIQNCTTYERGFKALDEMGNVFF